MVATATIFVRLCWLVGEHGGAGEVGSEDGNGGGLWEGSEVVDERLKGRKE